MSTGYVQYALSGLFILLLFLSFFFFHTPVYSIFSSLLDLGL